MNLSSIVVFTSPPDVKSLHARLDELPGIEVHYQCYDTGRLVVIQEASDTDSEMDGLQRIKALPRVMAAEMFYHYAENNTDGDAAHKTHLPAELSEKREALSWE